ncbi:MAG: acetate--CoA ligase [Sphingomonadales bacterium]|nr:acetate--CoA ligase [Sphingomonadales bacterium]PIX67584.1 MAG: acetate--CoA ligase [Sphingomonadales bacterium CG_4_10_14_3_um_filter_58_15]NCO49332.1 acetate--CoA ligase [Sphingomonadales bacterium]NCO99504.1 acetate--CoA ligase [Sphingomonadales bacterium]NCP27786.1 acetate--CoA ligase [Sphingomonadales bacterium]
MTEAPEKNNLVEMIASPRSDSSTHCTAADYDRLYRESIDDPDSFWSRQAERLDWETAPGTIANWSFDPVSIKWYEDGVLNICHNTLDRHVAAGKGDVTALIFEPDDPQSPGRAISYADLLAEVIKMANCLKKLGVKKGDRVTIYMPMIPEGAIAMLACARIGAIHSVVFGGFSPDALAGRIEDCDSKFVICADGGLRGGKSVPLKTNVDAALEKVSVEAVLVINHTDSDVTMTAGRDHWYHELKADVAEDCPCEPMNAEDPLFILYTSGSTGKPKGVLHTTGGYAVWVATTFHYVFDYQPGEVFWCSADIGWVTGHSYIVYGPLLNGATELMFEGIPNYPDFGRFWEVVEKHKVNIFYTAPTAIRALMREGDGPVKAHDRSSIRLLGTVGEPINPEAWLWYYNVVGDGKSPIIDTWWQTETGGVMITTLPGAHGMKPGSAGKPFFGVQPQLVDGDGKILEGATDGNLCLTASWPGQARSVYGDHERFIQTYFSTYKGKYFTGDGCKRDADDYYWITGRVDDVINVSGHRMGTAEVESALVSHPKVAEAAVVGYPHDIKGQGIYCYVTLNAGEEHSDELVAELRVHVRTEIGPIATPDHLHLTPALPKTRSGKIMRRILRKIAENDHGALGDTSTLADPSVVDSLVEGRLNK